MPISMIEIMSPVIYDKSYDESLLYYPAWLSVIMTRTLDNTQDLYQKINTHESLHLIIRPLLVNNHIFQFEISSSTWDEKVIILFSQEEINLYYSLLPRVLKKFQKRKTSKPNYEYDTTLIRHFCGQAKVSCTNYSDTVQTALIEKPVSQIKKHERYKMGIISRLNNKADLGKKYSEWIQFHFEYFQRITGVFKYKLKQESKNIEALWIASSFEPAAYLFLKELHRLTQRRLLFIHWKSKRRFALLADIIKETENFIDGKTAKTTFLKFLKRKNLTDKISQRKLSLEIMRLEKEILADLTIDHTEPFNQRLIQALSTQHYQINLNQRSDFIENQKKEINLLTGERKQELVFAQLIHEQIRQTEQIGCQDAILSFEKRINWHDQISNAWFQQLEKDIENDPNLEKSVLRSILNNKIDNIEEPEHPALLAFFESNIVNLIYDQIPEKMLAQFMSWVTCIEPLAYNRFHHFLQRHHHLFKSDYPCFSEFFHFLYATNDIHSILHFKNQFPQFWLHDPILERKCLILFLTMSNTNLIAFEKVQSFINALIYDLPDQVDPLFGTISCDFFKTLDSDLVAAIIINYLLNPLINNSEFISILNHENIYNNLAIFNSPQLSTLNKKLESVLISYFSTHIENNQFDNINAAFFEHNSPFVRFCNRLNKDKIGNCLHQSIKSLKSCEDSKEYLYFFYHPFRLQWSNPFSSIEDNIQTPLFKKHIAFVNFKIDINDEFISNKMSLETCFLINAYLSNKELNDLIAALSHLIKASNQPDSFKNKHIQQFISTCHIIREAISPANLENFNPYIYNDKSIGDSLERFYAESILITDLQKQIEKMEADIVQLVFDNALIINLLSKLNTLSKPLLAEIELTQIWFLFKKQIHQLLTNRKQLDLSIIEQVKSIIISFPDHYLHKKELEQLISVAEIQPVFSKSLKYLIRFCSHLEEHKTLPPEKQVRHLLSTNALNELIIILSEDSKVYFLEKLSMLLTQNQDPYFKTILVEMINRFRRISVTWPPQIHSLDINSISTINDFDLIFILGNEKQITLAKKAWVALLQHFLKHNTPDWKGFYNLSSLLLKHPDRLKTYEHENLFIQHDVANKIINHFQESYLNDPINYDLADLIACAFNIIITQQEMTRDIQFDEHGKESPQSRFSPSPKKRIQYKPLTQYIDEKRSVYFAAESIILLLEQGKFDSTIKDKVSEFIFVMTQSESKLNPKPLEKQLSTLKSLIQAIFSSIEKQFSVNQINITQLIQVHVSLKICSVIDKALFTDVTNQILQLYPYFASIYPALPPSIEPIHDLSTFNLNLTKLLFFSEPEYINDTHLRLIAYFLETEQNNHLHRETLLPYSLFSLFLLIPCEDFIKIIQNKEFDIRYALPVQIKLLSRFHQYILQESNSSFEILSNTLSHKIKFEADKVPSINMKNAHETIEPFFKKLLKSDPDNNNIEINYFHILHTTLQELLSLDILDFDIVSLLDIIHKTENSENRLINQHGIQHSKKIKSQISQRQSEIASRKETLSIIQAHTKNAWNYIDDNPLSFSVSETIFMELSLILVQLENLAELSTEQIQELANHYTVLKEHYPLYDDPAALTTIEEKINDLLSFYLNEYYLGSFSLFEKFSAIDKTKTFLSHLNTNDPIIQQINEIIANNSILSIISHIFSSFYDLNSHAPHYIPLTFESDLRFDASFRYFLTPSLHLPYCNDLYKPWFNQLTLFKQCATFETITADNIHELNSCIKHDYYIRILSLLLFKIKSQKYTQLNENQLKTITTLSTLGEHPVLEILLKQFLHHLNTYHEPILSLAADIELFKALLTLPVPTLHAELSEILAGKEFLAAKPFLLVLSGNTVNLISLKDAYAFIQTLSFNTLSSFNNKYSEHELSHLNKNIQKNLIHIIKTYLMHEEFQHDFSLHPVFKIENKLIVNDTIQVIQQLKNQNHFSESVKAKASNIIKKYGHHVDKDHFERIIKPLVIRSSLFQPEKGPDSNTHKSRKRFILGRKQH